MSDLGFAAATGGTSGVAWTATAGRPATGGASDSTFRRNYFGAYTVGAQGLVIDRVAFLDNVIYGFDPHTGTNDTLVTHSVAARNGRHGFIFSEGCDRNLIRDSEAYLNGGTGFMIDDGTPEHGPDRASDGNRLLRVSAHDSGDAGVVIEGGSDNSVERSEVTNNEYGVWVREGAEETDIAYNRISATDRTGVLLAAGLGATRVTDTDVIGADVGVRSDGGSATLVADGVIRGTASAGLRLDGDQSSARFDAVVVDAVGSAALDVRGTPPPAAARDGIATGAGAPFWAGWTLASALHSAILLLWSAILVLPLASRTPLVRRLLTRSGWRRGRAPCPVAPTPGRVVDAGITVVAPPIPAAFREPDVVPEVVPA